MAKVIDLTGKEFNFLKVIRRGTNTNQGQTRWLCKCRCNKEVEVISSKLRSGHTKSCGCWNSEVVIKRNKASAPHGLSKHVLWSIFSGMKERCYNPNCKEYKYYGERGINVEQAWIDNPQLFFDHIGKRPSAKHSIDRIKNGLGYIPGNVRWATATLQANNRRSNRIITTKWGESKTLSAWSSYTKIPVETIYSRLGKLDWNVEQALEFEAAPERVRSSTIFFTDSNGVTKSIKEWAQVTGIGYRTLLRRKNFGWSDTKILTTKVRKSKPYLSNKSHNNIQ